MAVVNEEYVAFHGLNHGPISLGSAIATVHESSLF